MRDKIFILLLLLLFVNVQANQFDIINLTEPINITSYNTAEDVGTHQSNFSDYLPENSSLTSLTTNEKWMTAGVVALFFILMIFCLIRAFKKHEVEDEEKE